MEGDDIEYMSTQMKELDKQVFKLQDSNKYLQKEGKESGLEEEEIEEICNENEEAIVKKLEEIKRFAKRFKPDDERLPLIIPFCFNMLPEEMRNGKIIDIGKVLKEIEKREKIARELAAIMNRKLQMEEYTREQESLEEEKQTGGKQY